VVTRAADQVSELAGSLEAAGATVIPFATIAIEEAADGGAELATAAQATAGGAYTWVVFTSQNAVRRLVAALPGGVRPSGAISSGILPSGLRFAAVGPATAAVVESEGLVVDLVPSRHVAEGLLSEFPPPAKAGERVLLPQAAGAREVLASGLRKMGYEVDVVEAYRTETARPRSGDLEEIAGAHAVTFTSSSTVTGFVEIAGSERVPPVVACIGPITASTAVAAGLSVDVVAADHSVNGLVTSLVEYAARSRPPPKSPKTHPGTVAE
jgi:uroporphyrinogen-III synthase